MGYLQLNDYKSYIQPQYLKQLIQDDDNKRVIEERASLQSIAQKLTQKYDLDLEFTDMLPYDRTKAYGAATRVTVDFAPSGLIADGFVPWVTLTAYAVGDLVIYLGVGYICKTSNTDAAFTIAKWTSVGAQYTIYYAAYPSTCTLNGQPNPATLTQPYAPVFNYKNLYSKDDVVFWKGNTYVCAQQSTVFSHNAKLQYTEINNIPYANVFPDDPVNNNMGQYWKDRTEYVVTADTPLINSAWVRGDNRNQTIKDAMVRITVFKLSPLLAPMNRPEVWFDDYKSMHRELKEAAEGLVTMTLPLKQPNNAVRTWFGGEVKMINNY